MAYKFQLGAAQLSGALVQEGAIAVHNEAGTKVADFSQAGVVSGSGQLQGASLAVDGAAVLGGSLTAVGVVSGSGQLQGKSISIDQGAINSDGAGGLAATSFGDGTATLQAGALSGATTLDASGLASLDGGIDVNGNMTVSTAGVIAGATDISGSGAIKGATAEFGAIQFQGASEVRSNDGTIKFGDNNVECQNLQVDDGATIGPDSVSDLWTYSAAGDTTQKDGAYDFNVASHDGTNGLLLGGTLVSATAAQLNYNSGVTAGTAIASKAVVLDASKDVTGISSLTASFFKGNGAALTNIDVSNLDAVGSDTYVQFNQNGEFGAAAGFTFDGTGSVATTVKISSVALSASAAVSAASFASDGDAVLGNVTFSTTGVEQDSDGGHLIIQNTDADKAVRVILGANNTGFSGFQVRTSTGAQVFGATDQGVISGSGALSAASFAADGAAVLGGSVTAGTSFIIGSADLNEADMEKLDGITNGTAAASKAVVLDASKDITGITNITASFFKGDGSALTNISSDSVDVADSSADSEFRLVAVAASGDGVSLITMDTAADLVTINASTGKLTLAGPGIAIGAADVTEAEFEFLDGATAGTAVASKALVVDASKDLASLNDISAAGLTLSDLTDNRLPLVGASGLLQDNAQFTYSDSRNPALGGYDGLIVSSSASGSNYLLDGYLATYDSSDDLIFRVMPGGVTSRVDLAVSGSSAGISVNSEMDGGASITAVGHINAGSTGGGNFEIILNSNGNISGSGNLSIGADGTFAGGLFPLTDDSYDLGEAGKQWKDLYVDGVAYIDDLRADALGAALNCASQAMTNINVDSGAIDGTIIGANSQAAAEFTTLSGSSTLKMGGNIDTAGNVVSLGFGQFAGKITANSVDSTIAATTVAIAASDSVYFSDFTDSGIVKKSTMDQLGLYLAGAGITNTAGVLSVSAVSTPTSFTNTNVTLVEGLNYASATWDGAYTLTLPDSDDLDVGEFVKIKMAAGVTSGNNATVAIKPASSDLIDGQASIILESPYAAVNLYKVATNVWRIL